MSLQSSTNRALRISAFLADGMVSRHWGDEEALREGARALRRVCVEKVYLDVSRGTHPNVEALTRARDVFREFGLEVGGGLTPVQGRDFGEASSSKWWWLCYTSAATARDVENAARVCARLFDEVLVDDLMATDCRCARCEAAKGGLGWDVFYQRLLAEFASKHIIEPAREENPRVRVIIKYPQWYDGFHLYGYEVEEHPRSFDLLWVGTETRDIEYEYVEPYQAFANYRWLVSIAGEKVRGGWFDQIECYPEVYLEQAYQTVLAGAPEIALFVPTPDYLARGNAMIEALREELPRLRELARVLRGRTPEGVVVYKPRGSDPGDEAYLFDVLGAMGIPVAPSAELPEDAACVVLGVHAAADASVVKRLKALVERGATVLLTGGFLARCGDPEVLSLAGQGAPPERVSEWCFRFEAEGNKCRSATKVPFRWALRPGAAKVLARAQGEGGWFPILTENLLPSGARVLAMPIRGAEYGEPLALVVPEPLTFVQLARPVVQLVRDRLLAPLGIGFSAPNRVALYPYGGGVCAVANYTWREAKVEVEDARWGGREVREWLRGAAVAEADGKRQVVVSPRTTILLMPKGEESG